MACRNHHRGAHRHLRVHARRRYRAHCLRAASGNCRGLSQCWGKARTSALDSDHRVAAGHHRFSYFGGDSRVVRTARARRNRIAPDSPHLHTSDIYRQSAGRGFGHVDGTGTERRSGVSGASGERTDRASCDDHGIARESPDARTWRSHRVFGCRVAGRGTWIVSFVATRLYGDHEWPGEGTATRHGARHHDRDAGGGWRNDAGI